MCCLPIKDVCVTVLFSQITTHSQIGSVIRNPEIMDLVPCLLAAIADPNHATKSALEILLQTVFVNTIDAASLVSDCEYTRCMHVCLSDNLCQVLSLYIYYIMYIYI